MKNVLLGFFLICTCRVMAQVDSLPTLAPYFSALIVADIDQSIIWYKDILGLELLKHTEHEEMAFQQANLRRGNMLLELIELGSAISPEDVVPNYNAKTKVIGIFKIGFKVAAFDQWMEYLEEKEVGLHGSVVEDDLSGKRMVIILDPDGNRIQLFEE